LKVRRKKFRIYRCHLAVFAKFFVSGAIHKYEIKLKRERDWQTGRRADRQEADRQEADRQEADWDGVSQGMLASRQAAGSRLAHGIKKVIWNGHGYRQSH
jgi:hypothetical protein